MLYCAAKEGMTGMGNVILLTQPEGFVKEPASGMGLIRLTMCK